MKNNHKTAPVTNFNPVCNFKTFQAALKRVASACSDDPKRPVLALVQVTGAADHIRLDSADGFRLHRVTVAAPGAGSFACLLSPEQIEAILKTKTARKDDPDLSFDLKTGRASIDGKQIPGEFDRDSQYPDVNCLFPKQYDLLVTVDPAALLQAVKSARVFSREGSNVVQLHFADSLVVIGKSEETGESHTVVDLLKINRVRRHDIAIGFNADFLVDYLKQAAGHVTISLTKPNSPAIFTDEADFTGLVMPMHFCTKGETVELVTAKDLQPESAYDTTGAYITTRESYAVTEFENNQAVELTWDCFTAHPTVDSQEWDIDVIWSYLSEDDYKKSLDKKVIVFHFANPRPDPNRPVPAASVPLFANAKVSFAKCDRCGDGPSLLRAGLCLACRESDLALAESHPNL